ncbi:hypothetical protein THRCLA_02384 [Thraustotheca clavata]|uniref:Secreted protein n=1 Tax=Thraustotheca clavata TaxID=74557 RepID=A0A1W0A5E6_9STRA|nr:hypothetical protein THRCLA_02384 [Thraustotheca clavata]
MSWLTPWLVLLQVISNTLALPLVTVPQENIMDIGIDLEGNTISCSCRRNNAVFQKYNPRGNLLWSLELPSKLHASNCATRLVVTPEAIYTTGYECYTDRCDLLAAKLHHAGAILWIRYYGVAGKHFGYGITTRPNANSIYVVGSSFGVLNDDIRADTEDLIVLQLSSVDGQIEWTRQIDSFNHGIDQALDVCINEQNHLFIVGQTNGNITQGTIDSNDEGVNLHDGDIFILSLNSQGHLIWTHQLYLLGVDLCYEAGCGILIDENSIYVTGTTHGLAFLPLSARTHTTSLCFDSEFHCSNSFVVKLQVDDGSMVWSNQLTFTAFNFGRRLVQSNDGIVLAGSTTGGISLDESHIKQNAFVCQFNSMTGEIQWVHQLQNHGSSKEISSGVVMNTKKEIILAIASDDVSYLQKINSATGHEVIYCTNTISFLTNSTIVDISNWTSITIFLHRQEQVVCGNAPTIKYTTSNNSLNTTYSPALAHEMYIPSSGFLVLNEQEANLVIALALSPPSWMIESAAFTIDLSIVDNNEAIITYPSMHLVILAVPPAMPIAHLWQNITTITTIILCLFCIIASGTIKYYNHRRQVVHYSHVETTQARPSSLPPLEHLLHTMLEDPSNKLKTILQHDEKVHPSKGKGSPRKSSKGKAKPKAKKSLRAHFFRQTSNSSLGDAND